MGRLGTRLPVYPVGTTGVTDVINLEDNEKINFGSSDDVAVYWDGTRFVLNPASGETASFEFGSGETILRGGDSAGDDLTLLANTSNFQAALYLRGGANIDCYFASGSYFTLNDGTTECLKVTYSSNVTTLSGGAVSGDDLVLKASTADASPKIELKGNDVILFTGTLSFGTHTGSGDVACNGYITVKDAGGTDRKIMTTA